MRNVEKRCKFVTSIPAVVLAEPVFVEFIGKKIY